MRDINSLVNNLNGLVGNLDNRNGSGYTQSFLGFTHNEYNDFLKLIDAPMDNVMEAFEKLGFSIDALEDGIIDITSVEDKLNGNLYLPKRYEKNAYSNLVIAQNILKEINRVYGRHELEQTLQYLQISPHYLDNYFSEKSVSTELNADLYKYIKKYLKGNKKTLYNVGINMYRHYNDTEFAKSFSDLSAKQTYAKLLEEVVNHVEASYDYTLAELSSTHAVLHKRLKPEILEDTKNKIYGSSEVCEYSIGFASSILYHATGTLAQARETRCIYDGHDYCEYVIDFETPIAC